MKNLLSFTFSLFFVLALLTGCVRDKQVDDVIADARHLLDISPDSALVILDGIKGKTSSCPKSQRMQYELVYAQAQNKASVFFETDSVVLEVADYYENHGTSSDRMKAYYIVGCAYRDLGDAPSALKYMNMAADAVGNTDNDEDKRVLMTIHCQMANLYRITLGFENEYSENLIAENLSWQLCDTLTALTLKYFRACNLYNSNHQLHALSVIDTIEAFASDNNLVLSPSLFYQIRIGYQLQESDFLEVERLLSGYERDMQISLSSPDSDISDVAYFLHKGRYFNMKGQSDSAIIVFHRLMENIETRPMPIDERNSLMEASYRYLAESYKQKQQADSVIKYSELYCALNDSTTLNHSSEHLLRMQSLYNYSKIQEQALLSEQSMSKLRLTIVILIFVVVLSLFVAWFLHRNRVHAVRRAQIDSNKNYQMLLAQIRKSEKELRLFKDDAHSLLREKEEENRRLMDDLAKFQSGVIGVERWVVERLALEGGIASHLHAMSAQGRKAMAGEFDALRSVAQKDFPNFYSVITAEENGLTELDIVICVLIRFHFIPSEIAILTGRSSQRITNMKTSINKKLFGEQGAKTLDSHLLRLK